VQQFSLLDEPVLLQTLQPQIFAVYARLRGLVRFKALNLDLEFAQQTINQLRKVLARHRLDER
jgi:hypothetical protein